MAKSSPSKSTSFLGRRSVLFTGLGLAAAGTVTLKVVAGDAVKRGDALAEIDSPELRSALAQVHAADLPDRFGYAMSPLDRSTMAP